MTSNITQIKIVLPIILLVLMFSGCKNNLKPPAVKDLSQSEWTTMQTRYFNTQNTIPIMKALMSALQDEGYIISTANIELGLVTASKELSETDTKNKKLQELLYGRSAGYQTSKRIDVNCIITTINKKTKIKINLIAQGKTESGGTLWAQPIDNAQLYQDIFNKIDKSIF